MKSNRMRIKPEFEKFLEEAKPHVRNITGKKRITNADAQKFVTESCKFWRGKDISFEK